MNCTDMSQITENDLCLHLEALFCWFLLIIVRVCVGVPSQEDNYARCRTALCYESAKESYIERCVFCMLFYVFVNEHVHTKK